MSMEAADGYKKDVDHVGWISKLQLQHLKQNKIRITYTIPTRGSVAGGRGDALPHFLECRG